MNAKQKKTEKKNPRIHVWKGQGPRAASLADLKRVRLVRTTNPNARRQ
jgi:hypothetical protein